LWQTKGAAGHLAKEEEAMDADADICRICLHPFSADANDPHAPITGLCRHCQQKRSAEATSAAATESSITSQMSQNKRPRRIKRSILGFSHEMSRNAIQESRSGSAIVSARKAKKSNLRPFVPLPGPFATAPEVAE